MKISFTKCHANGNDFILILENKFPKNLPKKRVINRLCNRNKGVGADGVLIISKSKNYDFLINYYNSDGSFETLCANGSRCACLYMYLEKKVKNSIVFEAGDGVHFANINNDKTVSMSMITPKYNSQHITPEDGYGGYFIDSGAPHFVTEFEDLNNKAELINIAKKIRFNKVFGNRGTNVNFYNIKSKNILNILTYEKGIEGFVLSCSSGSTAVVFHASKNFSLKSPITTVSSGGKLKFVFDDLWEDFLCIGPAEILFSSDFNFI
tara:strand:+ start:36 stop:830 length:795 start_codon:yes stop_codon:yes gene_type:complete